MSKKIYIMSREKNIILAHKTLIANIYSNAKMEGINVTLEQVSNIINRC